MLTLLGQTMYISKTYVSILLTLAGSTLMAWSAFLLMGILFAVTFLWDTVTLF